MSERKPTEGQLSPNLPGITAYLTGHDDKNGDTIIVEQRPARWEPIDNNGMAFNVPFTTARFPPSMKDNMDIAEHDARLSSGKLGIVNPNGTVLRCVDFAPGFESMMHRTQSLDYGIVIEGSIELSGQAIQILGHVTFLWHMTTSGSHGPLFAACCLAKPILTFVLRPTLWDMRKYSFPSFTFIDGSSFNFYFKILFH